MSQISEIIDTCIRAALAPALRREGYRRSGRTFHRMQPSCTHVVNVQASVGNYAGAGRFTINLGVYLPAVEPLLGHTSLIAQPKEYQCILRSRIGSLMPGGQDTWWEVDAATDLAQLGATIEGAWRAYGKPWLEQCASVEGALAWVRKHGNGELGMVLSYALDDIEQARRWLDECLTGPFPENYRSAIRTTAHRLGLLDA